MTVKDAINNLKIRNISSIEYSRISGIPHNIILKNILLLLNEIDEERKYFVKVLYGAEEEPNIKYILTPMAVKLLNNYIFMQSKSIISTFKLH